jgi:hypothetical protein
MNGYSNNNNLAIIKVLLITAAAVLPSVVSFGYAAPPPRSSSCFHKRCHRWREQDATTHLRYKIQLHMAAGEGGDELKVPISDDVDNVDINGGSSGTDGKMRKRQRIMNLLRRIFRRDRRRGQLQSSTSSLQKQQQEEESDRLTEMIPLGVDDAPIEDGEDVNDDATTINKATAATRNNTNTTIDDSTTISLSTRQATSSPTTDLSGTWTPIATPEFKAEYDAYLKNCSQSFLFRKVVVNGIEYQKEEIRQLDNGERLEIIAMNPAGNWNRTLVASSADNPVNTTIVDPDKDTVDVEAWWEEDGTKHRSILRGKKSVNGGEFVTVRYLDEEEKDVLVCESTFLPPDGPSSAFQYGRVVWKFRRC